MARTRVDAARIVAKAFCRAVGGPCCQTSKQQETCSAAALYAHEAAAAVAELIGAGYLPDLETPPKTDETG